MKHIRAATAAAEPPDDPPGTQCKSHGFRTGPKCGFDEVTPYASSCRLVLPTITAPAAASFSVTALSVSGT